LPSSGRILSPVRSSAAGAGRRLDAFARHLRLLPAVPGVRFLDSVAAIADEGAAMGHCAASYAESAVRGECYLFHVEHDGELATAEVAPDGRVVQV
jgi:hypothetical protein